MQKKLNIGAIHKITHEDLHMKNVLAQRQIISMMTCIWFAVVPEHRMEKRTSESVKNLQNYLMTMDTVLFIKPKLVVKRT